jgi:aspartate/methionine/tyrosine aminotransferase
MPDISRRTEGLGTENAFVVLAEVEALKKKGGEVISFCIGQPDFVTPVNIREAAITAIRDGKTGYTPSAGIGPLREAAARELGRMRNLDIRPDDIVVGAGCKPFIGYAIQCVTDYGAGHEVIYPTPGFPIYESLTKAYGAVPVALPLRESRAYAFDPDELEARINDRTRMVILCSPQNPTGGILSGEDLEKIAAIIRKHDRIWVYSDEVYSRLVYDGPFRSIASLPGMQHRTIIADGASKTWAMTGWRIGYAASRPLAKHFERWVTNTESCASHPSQYAALEALSGQQESAEEMKGTFLKRRNLIVKLLNEIPGVSCVIPGGAFYVWPNVTEACRMTGLTGSEELRRKLLHEAGIAVLADIHFGTPDKSEGQHIRFSYAASTDAIQKGLGRMADWVKKNTK